MDEGIVADGAVWPIEHRFDSAQPWGLPFRGRPGVTQGAGDHDAASQTAQEGVSEGR